MSSETVGRSARRDRHTAKKTAITICGSLRKDAINEVLRRHMSAKLREAGVEVTDLDLNDFAMPIFNQDIEDAGETPEAAMRLAELFRTHDIVFIATPEYNGGITPLDRQRHLLGQPAEAEPVQARDLRHRRGQRRQVRDDLRASPTSATR